MKPTKVRNYQIYRATYARRNKQLGSHLSEDLRKKYGKRSIRIIIGDTVKVIRGEYRGIDGKVSQISSQVNSIAIEGIKKEKAKGDKIDVFIPASNVLITGLNLDDHWRKSKLEGKKPKTTPKETKPTEAKEQAPKKDAEKEEKPIEKPKKEAKPVKKTEKQKESKPEKPKPKTAKKKKEAKE